MAHVRELDESALPAGDVTVAVEYSTLNYKDGLALSAEWRAGRADISACAGDRLCRDGRGVLGRRRYKPGDKVVLTGWRVGEVHWGGYAQKARVKADWLVPLPGGPDHAAGDGGGNGRVHGDAGGDGAGGSRADPGEGRGAGDRGCGRRRVGRDRRSWRSWAIRSRP